MVSLENTKKQMELMGIEFTDTQFSFAMLVSFGIDKYDAYKLSFYPNKESKLKEEERESFLNKVKSKCNAAMENNSIKVLVDYLKKEYDNQVNERLIDTSDDKELTSKQLKSIYTKLIVNYNSSNGNSSDLMKAMSDYIKNFPPEEEKSDFGNHFITIPPKPFNGICPFCNSEIDIPYGLSFITPCCGRKIEWDKEKEKYIY